MLSTTVQNHCQTQPSSDFRFICLHFCGCGGKFNDCVSSFHSCFSFKLVWAGRSMGAPPASDDQILEQDWRLRYQTLEQDFTDYVASSKELEAENDKVCSEFFLFFFFSPSF